MQTTKKLLVLGAIGAVAMAVTVARAESRAVRDAKKAASVSFRLAGVSPREGFERIDLGGDRGAMYVSSRPVWHPSEIASVRTRDGGLELTLTREAADRVRSTEHADDFVAVVGDGQVVSVGSLTTAGDLAAITGLASGDADRIVRLLGAPRPSPTTPSPTITLVPMGSRDGLFQIDVFVQGVSELRSYQVGLQVDGGDGGALVLEEVEIDSARETFVYRNLDAISAADQVGGRIAGVLHEGGIDSADQAYLGTYNFRATPEAMGTFRVSVAEMGVKTFLADARNERIEFVSGADALINVGRSFVRTPAK